MVSGDARVYVSFGREAKAGATVMDALDGAFADPHHVVEWRLPDGRPYAAIQRYFLDGKQALTVHRLNDDGSSCVAAVVAVERGHDANAEAARIADDVIPAFRCGVDKLITTAQAPPQQTNWPSKIICGTQNMSVEPNLRPFGRLLDQRLRAAFDGNGLDQADLRLDREHAAHVAVDLRVGLGLGWESTWKTDCGYFNPNDSVFCTASLSLAYAST